MESISLAVADYRDGSTKCQGLDGLGGVIPAMIYNHLSREIGARSVLDQRPIVACFDLTFPPSKCIIGARSSSDRFADEVGRGLKNHGEMKCPKSSSAESSRSSRSTTTSTFPKAGNRNHSSSRCTVMAATRAR